MQLEIRSMKRIVLAVFFCISIFLEFSFQEINTETSPKTEFKSKYVVILVIDGPRYTETFGDTSCQFIPFMGKEMVKEGTLCTQFKNLGKTQTTAGHTAITTGHYQSIPNNGTKLPKRPSIFQYYLKSSGADKSEVQLLSSKGKLQVLANTKDKKWWNTYQPSSYCGPNGNGADYAGDASTWIKIKAVFTNSAPKLTLINLLAVDVNGHGNNWEGYKQAIKNSDKYAYDLWQIIQSNKDMRNQTALFITNDHGRHLDNHKDGFVSHGDKCEGCQHISLLALGPDFKKNYKSETPAELIDISKTISWMLHFDMPTSDGRVLCELFLD